MFGQLLGWCRPSQWEHDGVAVGLPLVLTSTHALPDRYPSQTILPSATGALQHLRQRPRTIARSRRRRVYSAQPTTGEPW